MSHLLASLKLSIVLVQLFHKGVSGPCGIPLGFHEGGSLSGSETLSSRRRQEPFLTLLGSSAVGVGATY